MPIKISSSFDVSTQKPIDLRTTKADTTARDAITAGRRYQGLRVFVLSTQKEYRLQGGLTNAHWVEMSDLPLNGILEFSAGAYKPYAVKAAGVFDTGVVNPTDTTRLNYGGYFYSTRVYDNGIRVSTVDHTHTGVYEPVLGNPASNNSLVVSTTGGARSWATIASLLPIATVGSLGVIKVGAYLTIDANGVLNGQAGGTGGGGVWGTITGTLADQTDLDTALDLKAPLISPAFTTPNLGTPSAGTLTNCTFPTLNQNTTGTAASAAKLISADVTVEQTGSGGTAKLVTKFGATPVLSLNNDGVLTSITDFVAYGTI